MSKPSVLLDTCALIWIAMNRFMAPAASEAVAEAGLRRSIFVSPVSAWEIGLLAVRRRPGDPQFAPDPATWFEQFTNRPPIRITPLTPQIAIAASFLPAPLHQDPADRFLIATARHLGVPIVTRDRKIIAYGEAGHVAVLPC
jgi:PIN domain nuclease of toxin-antitoxin system